MKLSELALRPDLRLGPVVISPSRRLVEGPAGQVHLEPLIMQAFLLLLDARGRVVTRTELFDACWGGAMAGDDSLNRAIAGVRRISADVAPGAFEIETIPRTGYRLIGAILRHLDRDENVAKDGGRQYTLSRRVLVGGGVATAAALGAAGLWLSYGERKNPRFEALIERGEMALKLDEPEAAKYFEQAVAIEPGNSKARGLLAFALVRGRDGAPPAELSRTALAAERAARIALEIDPSEPNALHAMTFIQSHMLDWYSREERYRQILAIDPENARVMRGLGQLLHGVGRCRESLAVVNRALKVEPLSPDHRVRRAMRLWVIGRVADADRVIDQAMELWPSHRLVPMARLMIYAFTGRTRAALAMVEDDERNPVFLSREAASVWRFSLAALETRAPSDVVAAVTANFEEAKAIPAIAAYAILILSALNELDAAFQVADGFLLSRGSIIVRSRPEAEVSHVRNTGWRNTFGLFTPPTKAMRLDPRFGPLAEGLGLTDYWRRRGIGPDDFLFKA